MIPLATIDSCFEGMFPSLVCTCSRTGMPNVTFLSIVHRLDDHHVGLSYQFFNKTRSNIQENPLAQVVVISPETADQYRLDLRYECTKTSGTVFQKMKARLDAVASQTGMSHVFALRGVDVYRVLDCRPLNPELAANNTPKSEDLRELEAFTETIAACPDLDSLVSAALEALSTNFGYHSSFIMVPDESSRTLYTLASRGFECSGVGSEVAVGTGIIGVAAERRTTVRTANTVRDVIFARAVRSVVAREGGAEALETEIALPGLPNVQSQLVVPLLAVHKLIGVLCLQSTVAGRFRTADERITQIIGRHLAVAMELLPLRTGAELEPVATRTRKSPPATTQAVIKYFRGDHSIFIDDAYVIRGVAGHIFWKLVQAHSGSRRADFTNKEIRLDASLRMPDIKDNLEARLILLRRRLLERCSFIRITQIGRGRFHLDVERELTLEEHA